jgi:SAM-dependent methyltransferase
MPTTGQASRSLWEVYRHGSFAQRSLSALRPYICPVAPILQAVPHGAQVLDVGCGNGLALMLMARYAGIASGVGVEPNARALAAARRASAAAGLPLSFVQTGQPSEWPEQQFDCVTMIDVLHHLPGGLRQAFVHKALERTAANGRFVFKDMALVPAWRAAWNSLHDLALARQLVRIEPLDNVIRWAAQCGFHPSRQEAYVACALYGHELVVFERKA